MDDELYIYYREQFARLADIANKSAQNRERFFQQVLIVASGILGIVVALHDIPPECLYIRLVFLSATVLLLLCILTTSVVLHNYSMIPERLRAAFLDELVESIRLDRRLKDVSVDKGKRTSFYEKCSLILLFAGLVLLVAYTFMIII